ncbi:MAG: glycosyltransferase family 4 protein [Chitinophagaceae bacterium]
MKILHLITVNAIGGAEKLMPLVLPAQQAAGLEVDCLLLYHKNYSTEPVKETAEQLEKHNIRYFIVKCNSIHDKSARKQIADIINSNNYKLVHSHLKYADFFLSCLKKKKQINIPVISTLHGYRDSYQNKFGLKVSGHLFFSVYYWVTKFVFSQLDGYIFISACMKNFYSRAGLLRNRINRIIHHGYPSGNNLDRAEKFLSGKITSPQIGLPGRLIKLKGHSYAIDAIGKLIKDYPEITLHIFGSGPEEKAIRQHVTDAGIDKHVVFYGYVNDLNTRLKTMDVILVPSSGEAFGIVFLEAFASGVPVVAFDLPAGTEIIEDGYSGLLAVPQDATNLAMKVDKLCTEEDLYNRIREQASASLKEKFSLQRMVSQYSSFYQDVLDSLKQ